MEGFFPVYRGKVLPRGQYLLGWVSFTWKIPTSVGFLPVAIPTQVRVPETNRKKSAILDIIDDTTIVKHSLYSMSKSVLTKDDLHYNGPMRNFEQIFQLDQGESSSLGGVSTIMDIIWDVELGLKKTLLQGKLDVY